MQALGQPEEQRPPAGLHAAMRVLVLARDRQFKRMARLLFESRGAVVRTGADPADAVRLASRHRAEVVVLDASDAAVVCLRAAASLAALTTPVGAVLVTADADHTARRLAALPKWGPFEDLFAEVGRVHQHLSDQNWMHDAAL